MTRSICHQTRLTEEKNQRLLAFIGEVAGIDVNLLCIFLDEKLHPEAEEELNKLCNLIQAIQIELENDEDNVDDNNVINDSDDDVQETVAVSQYQNDSGDGEIHKDDDIDFKDSTALVVKTSSSHKDNSSDEYELSNLSTESKEKSDEVLIKDDTVAKKRPLTCKRARKESIKKSQRKLSHHQKKIGRRIKNNNNVEHKKEWEVIEVKKEQEGIEVKDEKEIIQDEEEIKIENKKGEEGIENKEKEECIKDEEKEDNDIDTLKGNIKKRFKLSNISVSNSQCICERCGKWFKSKISLRTHTRRHREEDANLSYNCTICGKQFNFKDLLRSHMKRHSTKKEFQCTNCGKCFLFHYYLVRHMRSHGEKLHICLVCNKSFNVIGNLRRHEKIHTGERPWKCMYCERAFNQSDTLKAHIRIHTGEKPYKCSLCSQRYRERNQLIVHNFRVHSKDIRQYQNAEKKSHKCPVCDRCFSQKALMTIHIRTHETALGLHTRHHTGPKPFKCDLCDKYFISAPNLKQHQQITHSGMRYKCDLCDKSFGSGPGLKQHQQITHSGMRYNCDLCDKSLGSKQALKAHQSVHSGEVHKCSVCNREFNQHSNLLRHMGTHSGSKPYKCHICDRSFSQKVNLETHMWTHKSEKRYKCDVCGKGYNDKRNLVSHTKTHSDNPPITHSSLSIPFVVTTTNTNENIM